MSTQHPEAPKRSKVHRAFAEALKGSWRSLARPEQVAPVGGWTTWVFCGGRGAGKTRSGAEWIIERVGGGARYIHLVAPTAADVRDVMLEGPGGVLSIAPSHLRPAYQPSLRKVVWPNGAQALLFSSDEPDRLRGPQCDTAWIDELCAMRQAQDVLDNMYFGLRIGKDPRAFITTTPRPLKCFKALLARDGQDVIVTRSSSFANRANLAAAFFSQITAKYAGTRLGRQELEAELLTDVPGALWHMERVEELRVRAAPQPFERVVVAIDPAVTFGPDSDETGIVVVGLAADGAAYVLDDLSGRYPPEEWARRAIQAYRMYSADRIVAEINNGGALVESTLRAVDPNIPFRAVHASRGKLTRAEPVSALYEQGRVHHVGVFGSLEDQMTSYDGARSGSSPDRLDALCWAVFDLLLGTPPGGFFKESALLVRPSAVTAPDVSALGAPVEIPEHAGTVYAVAGFSAERDALAVVYFAYGGYQPGQTSVPLTVLEWELRPIEGALPAWPPAVFERLAGLARQCKILHPRGMKLFVAPAGVGAALIQQALETGHYNVQPLDSALTAVALTDLAVAASAYVIRGQVKLSGPAYEQVADFKGTRKNHLLSQITAYGITTPEPPATELFTAWCCGILLALENPRRKSKH
jgi:predicted phage terminase large subunit-like protein